MSSKIQLFRNILRELRHVRKNQKAPFDYSPVMQYVISEFRNNHLTDAQKCARENESVHLAETYLNYLQNLRKHSELVELYKSKEKTTEEAAKMVGLALPETNYHE
ncbi:unnamed protein product [Schistosoma guineensis]|uniref:Protein FMC1 homolog n=5 Tax=Schistosoma TaxID=6181 RepID=A0A095AU16_SCHHA|nr:hypothetical protein MS3_00005641 [Schistosoma haematobium]RTG86931.1 uncharacterized protein DC041_0012294 [Schistosoma bovis]CAH8530682.1 unnamed protein product [Schistosoma mattheei]CAH8538436.1 unnamed protein product [Schistosoma intercalatum]CAH8547907.1 unnamed protein product [Schistosoma guineensis]CAH8551020.1 unnamed protein product [Schistosoma curassoni]CAI2728137.1 unnamed protein product [Schistosoma spindale]VDO53055.1 unnamed protein product [Schistosoma margrebowiei]